MDEYHKKKKKNFFLRRRRKRREVGDLRCHSWACRAMLFGI